MTAEYTRNRILDSAEILFAQKGISGTSLRAITKDAEANLAAVHYHFGSKEALLNAVLERRSKPVNTERLRLLCAMREESEGAPLIIEDVLAAYVMPGIRAVELAVERSAQIARLLVRIEAQPPEIVEALFKKNLGLVNRAFYEELHRSLPHLSEETMAERFRFALGTLSFIFSGNFDLDIIDSHPCRLTDLEKRLRHAIAFLAAALRAPEVS